MILPLPEQRSLGVNFYPGKEPSLLVWAPHAHKLSLEVSGKDSIALQKCQYGHRGGMRLTLMTGERQGYYADFGTSTAGQPGERFVIFTKNHDQIGNRMKGDRLGTLTNFEGLKLAAGAMKVLFIPSTPPSAVHTS